MQGASREVFVCRQCGEAFWRRRKGRRDRLLFCSRQCAGVSKRVAKVSNRGRACLVCGLQFIPTTRQLFCSAECRSHQDHLGVKHCIICAEVIPVRVGHTRGKFCSIRCRRASLRMRDSFKRARRTAKARRRARLKGVACDFIDPIQVFKSARWRCVYCGEITLQERRGQPHPLAPELDHVIPLSMGGTHTMDNVCCSCRKCNSAKGSSLVFAWNATVDIGRGDSSPG